MNELTDLQRHVLIEIENTASTLRNYIEGVQISATKALEAMSEGKLASNGYSFGPIGHQAPFDITSYTVRLQGKIEMAQALKIPAERIQEAYENGSIGLTARFERDRKADQAKA
ncbi:hypothetical protein SEA_KARATE_49 [Microbacterium phage Karate]|nr:hypothetical protein SEA_KARATE_49 [Microbacterium phage Karate]